MTKIKKNKEIIINNKNNYYKYINPNYFSLNYNNFNGFILKSYSEDDIHKSVKYGIWSSTKEGNKILNNEFLKNIKFDNVKKKIIIINPIFLFFSVNKSGIFNGMAIMKSKVNFNLVFDKWMSKNHWEGWFRLEWIFLKDLNYNKLKNVKNDYNNKNICESRDCTKISKDNINLWVNQFLNLKNFRSIVDDFQYYNERENKL